MGNVGHVVLCIFGGILLWLSSHTGHFCMFSSYRLKIQHTLLVYIRVSIHCFQLAWECVLVKELNRTNEGRDCSVPMIYIFIILTRSSHRNAFYSFFPRKEGCSSSSNWTALINLTGFNQHKNTTKWALACTHDGSFPGKPKKTNIYLDYCCQQRPNLHHVLRFNIKSWLNCASSAPEHRQLEPDIPVSWLNLLHDILLATSFSYGTRSESRKPKAIQTEQMLSCISW